MADVPMSRFESLTAHQVPADRSIWDHEPSTLDFLARFPDEPGVYVFRHHSAYQQLMANIFKVGRCNALKPRFKDYRGVMTIVSFMPTPFPRVVEMLILSALRKFVMCGLETLNLPVGNLMEVCNWAVKEVALFWQPRCASIAPHYHEFTVTIDRELRGIVKTHVLLNEEVRAYGKMTQQKGGGKGKATAKRKRDSWALVFQEIRCPYERVHRASKKRVAVSTTPDDAAVLEDLIERANEEIIERLDEIVASGENLLDALADEREKMVRFDRAFWNGRVMEKVLPYVDGLTAKFVKSSNAPLNGVEIFVEERCVQDAPNTPLHKRSFLTVRGIYEAYCEWEQGSIILPNKFGQLMTLLTGTKSVTKREGGLKVRGRYGVRLKTAEES